MRREWRIDAIEEDTAAVEENGELRHVPRWLLPEAARENDIIVVSDEEAGAEASAGGERRRITLTIDRVATEAALEASRRRTAATPPQRDPGGPIRL